MDGTIKNIERRTWLWDHRGARGPEKGHDLHDSLPYPFEPAIQMIFDKKDVLEIGPGNGRQYEKVRPSTKSYCIADISQNALDEPVFSNVDGKFLIRSWGQKLGRMFDVVHFWYVLHHVRRDEMEEFFLFISNHLNPGGLVAFNCPQPINVQGSPEGDGEGTTYSDPGIVRQTSAAMEMLMSLPVSRKSTGFVFLLRKGLGS